MEMKNKDKFIERRREYRLPYGEKVILTDGENTATAYALNVSRGGMFVKTLSPFPIETIAYLSFFLPNNNTSICVKAKVAHIVFDRQRCEIDCGMGTQFIEMDESLKKILNLHMVNEQKTYLELKQILSALKPDPHELKATLQRMPSLQNLDLLALRYRVNRICTLFEPSEPSGTDARQAQLSA